METKNLAAYDPVLLVMVFSLIAATIILTKRLTPSPRQRRKTAPTTLVKIRQFFLFLMPDRVNWAKNSKTFSSFYQEKNEGSSLLFWKKRWNFPVKFQTVKLLLELYLCHKQIKGSRAVQAALFN